MRKCPQSGLTRSLKIQNHTGAIVTVYVEGAAQVKRSWNSV